MKVLLTGANRGLGLEFAKTLSARGDHVIATARDPEAASALQAVAANAPGHVEVLPLDVTDDGSVAALAKALEGRALDLLIANAGVLTSYARGLGDLDYEGMRRCFEVNTIGALRTVEACLPALRRGEGKQIVTISSKMGSIEENSSGGAYAYRISKAAVNMAMRSVSRDLEPEGFRTLTLHPGWVQTDMGGPNALIDTPTSIAGMLRIIDGDAAGNGEFWEYKENVVPW